jgi:hypothetical protein
MIQRLVRFLAGASFHRGLALGALVGAAIAGSTLWSRLRANAARRESQTAAE